MNNQYFQNTKLDDNNYVLAYQNRMSTFNRVHDILEKQTNDKVILDSEGDLCSPLVIVLKDKSQDDILSLYKVALESYNLGLNNIRVCYLDRCSNTGLNLSAFKTEVEEVGNTAYYILHDFDCPFIKNKSLISYSKFNKLNDDNISEEEQQSLQQELWQNIYMGFEFLLNNIKIYR